MNDFTLPRKRQCPTKKQSCSQFGILFSRNVRFKVIIKKKGWHFVSSFQLLNADLLLLHVLNSLAKYRDQLPGVPAEHG